MTMPDPTVQLRPYAATAELERPIVELKAGTWQGRVVVRRYVFGSRSTTRPRFAVAASWHGPPMDGFARQPGDQAGDREDLWLTRDLELAKAVAQAAIDELRAARVPDLRAIARTRFGAI